MMEVIEMKKTYIEAEMIVVELMDEDVIRTSNQDEFELPPLG